MLRKNSTSSIKQLAPLNQNEDVLLDCSENDQVCMWAEKLKVSPQALKTAVRACCSNSIAKIANYLQYTYLPNKNAVHK